MKAKEIIPEVRKRPDIENIPYGFGSGAPVGGGIPAGRIEPTLGQIGSQAAQSAARIKSVSPNQPLPSPNVWRSGRDNTPMRSPGDKPQNIDDVVLRQINQAGRRGPGGPIPVPPAPGEQYVLPGVLGVGGAVGTGIYAAASDKGAKPTGSQSTPQAPARDPNMTQQTQDRLGISLDSQGRTASGATSAQTPAPAARPATAQTPAPVTTAPAASPATTTTTKSAGPQQGVVGSELAKFSGGEFATRADRLNQAKVDAILGSGYKAGTAAANLALHDHFRRQAIRQELERRSQGRVSGATVIPAGSDNSTKTVPEDKNSLTRLMKLSGQR